jgi:metacaspase-1
MATKAFLVGIDEYQNIKGLDGCENDVEDMANTLVIHGFDPLNIMIKTNANATRENILKGLNWLLENPQPDDKLIFYYAGHGSRVTDPHGDDPDGMDEVILPTDLDWKKKNYISDDDFRDLFSGLKEKVILEVIFDSCFSGTITRSEVGEGTEIPVMKERCVQPPLELRFHQDHVSFKEKRLIKPRGRDVVIVPDLNHVLWSACNATQTAKEITKNGLPRGAFTANFCEILRRSKNDMLPRKKVDALVKSAIKRNRVPNQTPQLEGVNEAMIKLCFC